MMMIMKLNGMQKLMQKLRKTQVWYRNERSNEYNDERNEIKKKWFLFVCFLCSGCIRDNEKSICKGFISIMIAPNKNKNEDKGKTVL